MISHLDFLKTVLDKSRGCSVYLHRNDQSFMSGCGYHGTSHVSKLNRRLNQMMPTCMLYAYITLASCLPVCRYCLKILQITAVELVDFLDLEKTSPSGCKLCQTQGSSWHTMAV